MPTPRRIASVGLEPGDCRPGHAVDLPRDRLEPSGGGPAIAIQLDAAAIDLARVVGPVAAVDAGEDGLRR